MTWKQGMAVVLAGVGGFAAFVLVPPIAIYLLEIQGLV